MAERLNGCVSGESLARLTIFRSIVKEISPPGPTQTQQRVSVPNGQGPVPASPVIGAKLVECCFTSTETVGLLGTGAQDVHLDFHTAPELWANLQIQWCFVVCVV